MFQGCYESSDRLSDDGLINPILDTYDVHETVDPILDPSYDPVPESVDPISDPPYDPGPDDLDAPDAGDVLPILHYTFDGNLLNTGTFSGCNGAWGGGSDYHPGRYGQAAKFDLISASHIILDNTRDPLSSYSQYTIGIWFKEYELEGYVCLLDMRSISGGFDAYHGLYPARAFTSCYSTSAGGGCSGAVADYDEPDGVWHHMIYRDDGTEFRIYVDGERKWNESPPGSIFSSGQKRDLQLGLCTRGDHRHSNLVIDDLRVYAEVFSEPDQCSILMGGSWNGTSCDF